MLAVLAAEWNDQHDRYQGKSGNIRRQPIAGVRTELPLAANEFFQLHLQFWIGRVTLVVVHATLQEVRGACDGTDCIYSAIDPLVVHPGEQLRQRDAPVAKHVLHDSFLCCIEQSPLLLGFALTLEWSDR